MISEKLKNTIKSIGPGILFAGAAIGGSHLIQSTRAGADYGFGLLWAIILINLFKYPFFEFGHRYTAATGKNLLEGYRELGNWAVWIFYFLSAALGIINTSAILIVTTGLLDYFINFFFNYDIETFNLAVSISIAVLGFLIFGRYALLDKIMKVLISLLGLFTLVAFILAWSNGFQHPADFEAPSYLTQAGLLFLIALMGWMPAPIELSVWSSLWQIERTKQTGYKPSLKDALTDYHIGFFGTSIIAIFFVGLGAFTMFGTGEVLSNNGQIFSQQLISLYANSIGDWVTPIISSIAFITMFSTAITVIDAYPRTLAVSQKLLFNQKLKQSVIHIVWMLVTVIASLLIITLFLNRMKTLLDIATTVSFIAAPVFAIINFIVITSKQIPNEFKPKPWLKLLSVLGIIFLVSFSLLFIYATFAW